MRFALHLAVIALTGARREELDGDVAIEMLVVSAVDLAHPARANAFNDSKPAERLANAGGH
jgi:hypothetical protein